MWSRNWSNNHGETLFTGFLLMAIIAFLLREHRTTCPGIAPPIINWDLLHESLIKKMYHRFAYSPILGKSFSIPIPSSLVTPAFTSGWEKTNWDRLLDIPELISIDKHNWMWVYQMCNMSIKSTKDILLQSLHQDTQEKTIFSIMMTLSNIINKEWQAVGITALSCRICPSSTRTWSNHAYSSHAAWKITHDYSHTYIYIHSYYI